MNEKKSSLKKEFQSYEGEGIFMSALGITGTTKMVPFKDINSQVERMGEAATSERTQEIKENISVSNFGNETKAGSSSFQENNARIN